jgi:hypothetical protein
MKLYEMGEGRKHPPFMGVQQIVWQSSLRGMERPVRSFKSFIRTVPPHRAPDSEKPLPPTPVSHGNASRMISSSTSPTPSIRSFSVSSWKAPAAWDDLDTSEQEIQTTPFFALRKYAPLLPEPSPSLHDSEEQSLWPIRSTSARQYLLTSIAEQDDHGSQATHATHFQAESLDAPLSEAKQNLPMALQDVNTSATRLATTVSSSQSHTETMSQTAELNQGDKDFALLDIQSNEDSQAGSEHWSAQPEASDDLGPTLLLHGKNIQQLTQENSKLHEMSHDFNIDDADMDEKLQKLSVSQDYHGVLADQYHEAHADVLYSMYSGGDRKNELSGGVVAAACRSPSRDHELMPRPLSWRKDLSNSSIGGSHSKMTSNAKTIPNSRKRYRKVAAWMHFRQSTHAPTKLGLGEDQSKSESNSTASMQKVDRFSKLIPHIKGSRSIVHQAKTADKSALGRSSPSVPHRPASPFISLPLEQPTPLFRLPGGLALVRHSPTPTQISRDAGSLGVSPLLNTPQSTATTDFLESHVIPSKRRPSSLYSQKLDAPVAPAIKLKKRLRSSLISLHSPQSHSNISSPPAPHEIAPPRTSPSIPRNFNSPTTELEATGDVEGTDSAANDEPHERGLHVGIMDRARDARQAWMKHHEDAKNEKLKKSIRVLGPTDPGLAAAYMNRNGRISEDGGMHVDKMLGYLGAGHI